MENKAQQALVLEEKKLPVGYIIGNACALMTNDNSYFSFFLERNNGKLYEDCLKDKELDMSSVDGKEFPSHDMLSNLGKENLEKNICPNEKNCQTCQIYLAAFRKLNVKS